MVRRFVSVCLVLALCIGGASLYADYALGQGVPQATISWVPNSEPDLAGYRVYQSTVSRQYAAGPVYLVPPTSTAVTVYLPQQRCTVRYYFTVAAFDWGGQESQKSVEVSKPITGTQYWVGACKK